MYRRWPPKFEALKAAKKSVPKGRVRFQYRCALCSKYHPLKNVEVDHKVPAGSLKNMDDLPGFVERLFCPADKLQVVCKPCHKKKTAKERVCNTS